MVRRPFALISQDDYEAFLDELPPEAVYDFSRRLLNPVVAAWSRRCVPSSKRERQMWEGGHLGYEPKELIDAGDKVLALLRVSGRGKASGVEVEAYTSGTWGRSATVSRSR